MSKQICALCQKPNELRKSHFIPKSIFKHLRRGVAEDLGSPVLVDLMTKKSLLSDDQPMEHLLCDSCEAKFDRNGERVVVPELRGVDNFILRDIHLKDLSYVVARDLASVIDLNFHAYAYFSLSIMWRGSVHAWPSPYHLMSGKLGPYQECFRSWLNGDGKFPRKTYVEIVVDSDSYSPAFGGPNISTVNDLGSMSVYQFIAHGVWFRVHVGGYLNQVGKEAFKGGEIPIAFHKLSFGNSGISNLAKNAFDSTTPVRKLASVLESRNTE